MSTAHHAAFENLFVPSPVIQVCDKILTSAAQRLVESTGSQGNLFPLLFKLATFKNGRQIESELRSARPQDVALLLGLELIRLNERRNFVLNVSVDPERRNGRLVNWGDPIGS